MKTNTRFWSYLAHFLLGWEMFQIKVVEKTKTHFVFSNFFFKTCRLWDKAEKYCRTWQATDDCGACALHGGYLRLHTHTHTHTQSEYAILIAFPLQQWLRERASVLRYTYIACRVLSWSWYRLTSSSFWTWSCILAMIQDFWDVTPCCWADNCRRFERRRCLHRRGLSRQYHPSKRRKFWIRRHGVASQKPWIV